MERKGIKKREEMKTKNHGRLKSKNKNNYVKFKLSQHTNLKKEKIS